MRQCGDLVITRKNERRLTLGRSWVKNGDRWEVTRANDDGSLTLRRAHSKWRTTITLPAAYVSENVELAYAVTAHRAQGSTVDTAHAIVHSPEMTRESLYVAMTRGRESNRVYVATDEHHLEEHQHRGDLAMTARSILYGILQHPGAELSAHETTSAEQDVWRSLAQLAAEYDTIAQEAQLDRWVTLLEQAGLTTRAIDELVETDSFGILTTELRRLEADGHDIDDLLPRVIGAGNLDDVDDLGSLLRSNHAPSPTSSSRADRPRHSGIRPHRTRHIDVADCVKVRPRPCSSITCGTRASARASSCAGGCRPTSSSTRSVAATG